MRIDPQVVVVIVNWERAQDTIACIESVLHSTHRNLRVVVVDNGSRDGSAQRIAAACPEVDLLPLPRNLGFAGGYNAGIERALLENAAHILLLNNDAVVESNAIGELLSVSYDIGVPKILRYDAPTRLWAAGAVWRRFPPSVVMLGFGIWGNGETDSPKWDVPRELEYATGCALMVKRRVFETAGGFDTDFGNYMEDYDFCFRARKVGFTIGYVPTARVLHKVSQSFGEGSSRKWEYLGQNTVLFYRKDNRFPAWMLWTFLAWVSAREVVRGNATMLPHFWKGVTTGLKKIENTHGTHHL